MIELPLLRSSLPVFAFAWELEHVIDAASPLAGLDAAAMNAAGLRFFLMIRAEDAAIVTTVRGLRIYEAADIRFGMRYVDALSLSGDGHPVLNRRRFGLLEADRNRAGDGHSGHTGS